MSPEDARARRSTQVDAVAHALERVPWSLVVVAVALAVRLYQLGSESLWIDEALSFARASKGYGELVADSIRRKHLPTYFLLLKFAMQFGDSETALRLPSALFGTATALIVYFAGRVSCGRVAGLIAGLLVALARLQVHHGQEARMYTLFTFAVSVAVLGFSLLLRDRELASVRFPELVRAARSGDAASRSRARTGLFSWACVLFGTTLALYTHNTAVFFLAAINVAALALWIDARGSRGALARNWITCMLCVGLLWAFWLPTLFGQSATLEGTWKGRAATPSWVALVLSELFLLSSRFDALSALLLAFFAHAVYVLRRRPALLLALLALACVGPVCAFIVSQKVPMFYQRTLLWTPLAWFLLVGIGVAGLPRIAIPIATTALVLAALPQLREYYATETKPGWRPLLQALVQETDEHSVILSARAERFLSYYFDRKSDPLPRRTWQHARPGKFEAIVGDAREFFVVAQTQERAFQSLRAAIAASGRYRVRWQKRDQNAIVIKYRRVKAQETMPNPAPD